MIKFNCRNKLLYLFIISTFFLSLSLSVSASIRLHRFSLFRFGSVCMIVHKYSFLFIQCFQCATYGLTGWSQCFCALLSFLLIYLSCILTLRAPSVRYTHSLQRCCCCFFFLHPTGPLFHLSSFFKLVENLHLLRLLSRHSIWWECAVATAPTFYGTAHTHARIFICVSLYYLFWQKECRLCQT